MVFVVFSIIVCAFFVSTISRDQLWVNWSMESGQLLSNVALIPRDSENDGELTFGEEQIFGQNNEVEEKYAVDQSMDLHTKMIWLSSL